MSDNGYVYAYRRSWSNPIFRNLKEAAVWNFLYQNAFWEDGERYYNNTKFNLKRGQIVLSISFLCKGFDMTDKEIRLLLDKLKRASMVAIKGANKGTIITICNYDKYQRLEKTEGQAKGKQKGNNNNEVNEVNEGMKYNIDFVDEKFKEIFSSWLSYKKDRKENYKSNSSLKICYDKLLKLSNNNPVTAKEIVENSIANNYAGLFELKKINSSIDTTKSSYQSSYSERIPL